MWGTSAATLAADRDDRTLPCSLDGNCRISPPPLTVLALPPPVAVNRVRAGTQSGTGS